MRYLIITLTLLSTLQIWNPIWGGESTPETQNRIREELRMQRERTSQEIEEIRQRHREAVREILVNHPHLLEFVTQEWEQMDERREQRRELRRSEVDRRRERRRDP